MWGGISGLCARCHIPIGGLFAKNLLWQCPTCKGIFCEKHAKTVGGRLFKKRLCPEHLIEMREGGFKHLQQ